MKLYVKHLLLLTRQTMSELLLKTDSNGIYVQIGKVGRYVDLSYC